MHVEVPTKRCVKCEAVKPAGEFYASRRSVDGLTNACKDCHMHRASAGRQRQLHQRQQASVQHKAAVTVRTGAGWPLCVTPISSLQL